MKPFRFSIHVLGRLWILAASAAGAVSTAVWMYSQHAWQQHQNEAFLAGIALQDSFRHGTDFPREIDAAVLTSSENALATQGDFATISGLKNPVYLTSASLTWQVKTDASPDMRIVIASNDLVYEISELSFGRLSADYDKLGQITKLMASVCSNPILFIQPQNDLWIKVIGSKIWGCDAAPHDLRLLAFAGGFLTICLLIAHVYQTSESFIDFSRALKRRHQIVDVDRYETKGPAELQDTIETINYYLETERQKLESRILLFSGVSHDLGTPAARLRLRAALINDADLREKFESDIDQMIDMIDGILTLSHSEMTTEAPNEISLSALVEAIVSDFQDIGHPIELNTESNSIVEGGSSVFSQRKMRNQVKGQRHLLVYARPLLLKRAISNLIENALKYGRTANVSLNSTSEFASVLIEDTGDSVTPELLNDLIHPFRRGDVSKTVPGVGLGLTISSNIAILHGGSLSFEQGPHGMIAHFKISRGLN